MTNTLKSPTDLWDIMNAEDTWLPLLVSATFWFSNWLFYRVIRRKDFSKWYKIHTLHHVAALAFGCASLYYNDNSVFHERIGIFWSQAYFVIDIFDSIWIGHLTYIFHAVICLGLGLCNYNIPLLMEHRMNSKAVFIETSSIILYQVKQNRNPTLFAVFAMTYTACRIVWIPIMGNELLEAGLKWTDPLILALMAFYALQIYWWIKILKIVWTGGKSDKSQANDGEQAGKKKD